MKPIIRSLIAGGLWGIVAAALAIRLPWYVAAGVFFCGPLIGAVVYLSSRWSYRSWFSTLLWTVPSMIFATVIFGFLVGVLDSIERGSAMIAGSMFSAVWGIL